MLSVAFLISLLFASVLGSDDYNEDLRCVQNCYKNYEGLLSTTISGKRCREWTRDDITEESRDDFNQHRMHNFCRRVNYKPLPWCYVQGNDATEWEYCFHFYCKHLPNYKSIKTHFCDKPGYFEHEGRCYTVLPTPTASRKDAIRMCSEQSSALVSLHTEKETNFVNALTCVPKMVSAKNRKGSWRWLAHEETTWGMDGKHWVWCGGQYYEHLTGNCTALMGLDCLAKVKCRKPEMFLYPACVYSPRQNAIAVNITNITWKGAADHCDNMGHQLCAFDDLCGSPIISKQNVYKSVLLPMTGNHWAPVGDEYNDWIYVGDDESGSTCERHNRLFGPPPWGYDYSVCSGSNSYEEYCSAINTVLCCEKRHGNILKSPVQVPVYIHSRMENGNAYYHYSKDENMTLAEVEKDLAEWRKYGRHSGDLRKFTLMSGFIEDKAEHPVYFCARNAPEESLLPTKIHKISLNPCLSPWRLNFYLYGRAVSLQDKKIQSSITVTTYESEVTSHSRVSEGTEFLKGRVAEKFHLRTPASLRIIAAPPQNPCQGAIEKIKSKVGVLASPFFPDPYPKRDPPIKCSWKVAAKKTHLIKIKFTAIKLTAKKANEYFVKVEENERFRTSHGEELFNHKQKCKEERVEISDPFGRQDNPNWLHYGTFCGDWAPLPFITTDNAVAIKFYGASSGVRKGFRLVFESIAPPRGLVMMKINQEERVRLTWSDARRKCREMEKDLCNIKDICGIGRPFYGVERGNQWSPILKEYNDWVQVGEFKGQTCESHNVLYGPPQWGVEEAGCNDVGDSSPCAFKSILYCCDPLTETDEILNEEVLPVADEVLVNVYTTAQNGRTFYRYIRDGIDTVENNSIWTLTRRHTGDLSRIILMSNYKAGFDKVVYFCSKPLALAIGQMRTVYSMFSKPCNGDGWKLLFYLYASSSSQEDTERIYVGISQLQPFHSRAHFGNFPSMFQALNSFIVFAATPDSVLLNTDGNSHAPEDAIEECSTTPVVVIAPGIIISPGYPKRYDRLTECVWRIRMSDNDISRGFKLKITIDELHLEDVADELLIYDAPLNATLDELPYSGAKKYTAMVRAVTLYTNNSFILHFKSDYSIEYKGFKIISEVISDKCGGFIKDHGATVTSMNYPRKYRGGLNCSWTVVAPNDGYGVDIQFGKFELMDSENCTEDYVAIGPTSNPDKYRYCGLKNIPPRLQFNESEIRVNFVTAEGKPSGRKGFIFNTFFWPLGNLAGKNRIGAQCGMQKIQPWHGMGDTAKDRIVGGTEAIEGSWPWVVYIKQASCGGALLSDRWVLSAGHCFAEKKIDDRWTFKLDVSNYTVTVGRHRRDIASRGEQVFQVKRIIIHPDYKRVRLGEAGRSVRSGIPINDIALIKLKQIAIFTKTIKPVCLPTQDVSVGETCVIAGWGARGIIATLSSDGRNALHYAHVYTLANSLCNTYEALRGSLTDKMMCAGYPGGGVDSCRGDSGGPLMCLGPKRTYQIKGVVSWGRGCGTAQRPGIYTRVWSYYDWISGIIYS